VTTADPAAIAYEVVVYPGGPEQFLNGLCKGEVMKLNAYGLQPAEIAPAGDVNIALAAQVPEQVIEGFSENIRRNDGALQRFFHCQLACCMCPAEISRRRDAPEAKDQKKKRLLQQMVSMHGSDHEKIIVWDNGRWSSGSLRR
jgi:hypothetical protein